LRPQSQFSLLLDSNIQEEILHSVFDPIDKLVSDELHEFLVTFFNADYGPQGWNDAVEELPICDSDSEVITKTKWCPTCGDDKKRLGTTGLELDIPYYHYGFAIEGQQPGDPNNFIKQQERDQLKEKLCEENWIVIALRYVWYYENPFEKIPDILQGLGLIP
ncbi:10429_t:CDS:2, partial [Paraglomus occultum]